MATALTEADAFTATVVAPDDGDDVTAAAFGVPYQSLANRTRYLSNRRSTAWALKRDPSVFGEGSSTGVDRALITQTVSVVTGDILIVQSSGQLTLHGGLGGCEMLHTIKIGGTAILQHDHRLGDPGSGVASYLHLALSACYVAAATGNVDVVQSILLVSGYSPQIEQPTFLSILKVRP